MQILTHRDTRNAIDALQSAEFVAIDTEFHAERRYVPQLYLVQIKLPGHPVWVVDPQIPDLLGLLGPHLVKRPWVLHAGRQDLRILHGILGAVPEQVIDVQIADGLLRSTYPCGFNKLIAHWLGASPAQSQTLSDWSRRPLTPAQLNYAAQDVEPLPDLWARLREALVNRGRLKLAWAAFREARDTAIAPANPERIWRRLTAASHLEPSSLHVLQRLTRWREEMAQDTNVPSRSILSDGVMVDLARKRPPSVQALFRNRRFPKSIAKKFGATLVQIVQEGCAQPEADSPRIPRANSAPARRLDFCRLVADAHCQREGYSRALLAPEDALQRIACGSDVATSLPAWSAPELSATLEGALRGEIGLRLHPDSGADLALHPISPAITKPDHEKK